MGSDFDIRLGHYGREYFDKEIKRRRWVKFCQSTHSSLMSIVKEFYANANGQSLMQLDVVMRVTMDTLRVEHSRLPQLVPPAWHYTGSAGLFGVGSGDDDIAGEESTVIVLSPRVCLLFEFS
ncbi:hypothetical protein ACH5RR_036982 [Cinchona calisaya]|uniref:Uncharacterized protein n=1 Tax=Cinchona calisaya TaxID=153742 RepID=A0ABD2YA98_9GENT